MTVLYLLLAVFYFALVLMAAFAVLAYLVSTDVQDTRKRRSLRTPLITVQTYFTITEAPFGRPVDLAYGARVAIPARFRAVLACGYPSFHALIQLPGAFIVR